jgi:uncharacterized cupin superfamily protein
MAQRVLQTRRCDRISNAHHALHGKSEADMKRKIDIPSAPVSSGSRYPEPFAAPCQDKIRRRLAAAAGLKHLGINLLELAPGAWSSQRHWHTLAEEFVYVLEGEVVLVTEGSEEILHAGDCAAFLAGDRDGPHLQNRSGARALILEIGSANVRSDETHYPDVDLRVAASAYLHKDGTPYP